MLHTPGPWRVIKRGNQLGCRSAIVVDRDNRHILTFDTPTPEQLELAGAIAALPDMLEALKRAAPWLGKMIADGAHQNSVLPNDCVRTLQMVENAIAEAEKFSAPDPTSAGN